MLFKTRMEEAREALKKLDFDDELILVHAEHGNQELLESVEGQVTRLIHDRAVVECLPLVGHMYVHVPFGEAMRAIYSATPIPLVMSHAERAELHQRRQRLLRAFALAGSALTLASKYETSIMKPESLGQTTDADRWMLCLFDAALWGPKGLPGGHAGRTIGLTFEVMEAIAPHGLPARCWYSRLPNCRDVSVGLIDLMLDIAEQNQGKLPSEEKQPAAVDENAGQQIVVPPPSAKAVYVSYAWGDDRSKAGRQRGEVVERLCDKLTEWGYKIDRDKNRLRNGDRVSKFMKEIGRGNRVLVVLSKKYLLSPNCMTELFYVYQHSIGDKEEFLRRVIPVVVDDARRITETDCDERVKYARHWQSRFEKLEPDLALLGEDDLKRYRLIKQWHAVIGDILGFISDELHPHGFDNIVKDDFAAVRELLDKYDGV
jgi:TIR domain-containing protein